MTAPSGSPDQIKQHIEEHVPDWFNRSAVQVEPARDPQPRSSDYSPSGVALDEHTKPGWSK
jgi:hypothetical protein